MSYVTFLFNFIKFNLTSKTHLVLYTQRCTQLAIVRTANVRRTSHLRTWNVSV